jgi:hypothetical protein
MSVRYGAATATATATATARSSRRDKLAGLLLVEFVGSLQCHERRYDR